MLIELSMDATHLHDLDLEPRYQTLSDNRSFSMVISLKLQWFLSVVFRQDTIARKG